MVRRRSASPESSSLAVYSRCMAYRYLLERKWDPALPTILFVMLNPSTATELRNDPTVERCERRARAMGFGSFAVCNIFALRSTDPRALRSHPEPVGSGNDRVIARSAALASAVVCAWGSHGEFLSRGHLVESMLRGMGLDLLCLGLCSSGQPRHPLYVGYSTSPRAWQPAAHRGG